MTAPTRVPIQGFNEGWCFGLKYAELQCIIRLERSVKVTIQAHIYMHILCQLSQFLHEEDTRTVCM